MSKKPTCPTCGGDNVVAVAAARWNPTEMEGDPDEAEGWEISNILDKGHRCDDCGAQNIEFVWVNASAPPTLKEVPQAGESASDAPNDPDDPACSSYRVTWTIDVEADSPQGAAESARAAQTDPDSLATLFLVESSDGPALCIDTTTGAEYPVDAAGTPTADASS